MYFIIVSSLLLSVISAAPQDLPSSELQPMYEENQETVYNAPQQPITDVVQEIAVEVKEVVPPEQPVIAYEAPQQPIQEVVEQIAYDVKEAVPEVQQPVIYESEPQQPTYDNKEAIEELPTPYGPTISYVPNEEYENKVEPAVEYDVSTAEPLPLTTEETLESRPLHKQTAILSAGQGLSKAITAKIVGPFVIFNSKLAAAAGALPPMLAAKGAVIGSAIATPVVVGAVASSAVVSGVTGKLVALPISVGAGALAKLVTAAESANKMADNGRQIWDFNVEHGHEVVKDGLIRMGHIILKPIAVIVGAQTALNGAGLGIVGSGIKGVGVKMETVGAKMVGAGMVAKGLGLRLIKF